MDHADEMIRRVETARSALGVAIPGYGLDTVQACRLEGGFIVAGWDCATEVDPQPGFERSPFELGLGWLVNLEATPFVGRDALAEQKKNGHAHVLRSFTTDTTDVPEDGAVLLGGTGSEATEVGIATCSNWSWGQNTVIGNASMRSEYADLESAWVEIAGSLHEVRLSSEPLFNPNRRNEVPASVELDPGRL
jgi:aminomethyltransferase